MSSGEIFQKYTKVSSNDEDQNIPSIHEEKTPFTSENGFLQNPHHLNKHISLVHERKKPHKCNIVILL